VPDFRCSLLSEDEAEPIAGTAPTDTDWLFVEDPRPWPAKATGHLADLVPGGRAQLIRRHGGASGPGIRVFRASLDGPARVRTVVVDDLHDLRDLTDADYTDCGSNEPLWLVCTNGRRDVCCAERGRPAAAQWADLRVRSEAGWAGLDDVDLLGVDGPDVRLSTPTGPTTVTVTTTAGPARLASCGDEMPKPTVAFGSAGER
jgi:hypothetical protein